MSSEALRSKRCKLAKESASFLSLSPPPSRRCRADEDASGDDDEEEGGDDNWDALVGTNDRAAIRRTSDADVDEDDGGR
jgi:hypothetical protein